MKRWQDQQRSPTKAEKRQHTDVHGNDRIRGKNPNYRTNNQHPRFADEVAQGQALCDAWAESFKNRDNQPRSR